MYLTYKMQLAVLAFSAGSVETVTPLPLGVRYSYYSLLTLPQ